MTPLKLSPNGRSDKSMRTLRIVQTRRLMGKKRTKQVKFRSRGASVSNKTSYSSKQCLPCQKNKQNRLTKYKRR